MIDDSPTCRQVLPTALVSQIALQCSSTVLPDLSVLIDALQTRFGQSLKAVLFYGSCLHNEDLTDAVVDLYAVVNDYQHAYGERYLRVLNACLPPNVFYMEKADQDRTIRTKYAVISMQDLERGTSDWFHPYLWARFSQPVRILYCQDESSRTRIHQALAQAVLKLLESSIPTMGNSEVAAEIIWTKCLALTYSAELRAERETQANKLVHLNLGDYIRLTASAAPALKDRLEILPHGQYRCLVEERDYRRSVRRWRFRRWQGRVLSVLRLAKAAMTFHSCVEYAAWKIERHTGVCIDVTPGLQRHPLLLGPRVLWQLLRRRTLR